MNIGIIGATGKAGSLIVREALERGHEVTAIVRNTAKVIEANVNVLEKDLFDLTSDDLKVFDVVVNAFNTAPEEENLHVIAGKVLMKALENNLNTRLIVVGGAGSLFVDEEKTVRLFDTPDFPKEYLATAKNMGNNLMELQSTTNLKWTYISPSAFFDPQGKRTGNYVSGREQLMANSKRESYISYPDYAIAVLDEIEESKHMNERFTVVSEG